MTERLGAGSGRFLQGMADRSSLAPTLRAQLAIHAPLIALLLVSFVVRLVLVPRRGFPGDVRILAGWAERMATTGSLQFYDAPTNANYPALLYLLWPLGSLFDDESLRLAVRALSIPFDLAIGVLLYVVARRWVARSRALLAAALYLLNPGVLIAGVYFGQVDAVGVLPFLVAVVASASGAYALAGGSAAVAALVKPQFALAAIVVAAGAVGRFLRERDLRPLATAIAGAALASVAIAVPLQLTLAELAEIMQRTAARQPFISVNALNPWGIVFGFGRPDGALFYVGALAFLVATVIILLPLKTRGDVMTTLAVASLLAMAFFFLPTRIHERYLFPVLALLAPLAAARYRLLAGYALMSAAFSLNVLFLIWANGSANAFDSIAGVLFSRPGLTVIGIVMLAGAAIAVTELVAVLRNRRPIDEPARVPPAIGAS